MSVTHRGRRATEHLGEIQDLIPKVWVEFKATSVTDSQGVLIRTQATP